MEFVMMDVLILMFILFYEYNIYGVMNFVSFLLMDLKNCDVVTDKRRTGFNKLQSLPFRSLFIYPFISLKGDFEQYMRMGGVYLQEIMKSESLRLKSFSRININNSPIRLAADGFYATGDGDETRCFSCGKRHNWHWWEKPQNHHHKPGCRHRNGRDPRNVPFLDNPLAIDDVIRRSPPVIPSDYDLNGQPNGNQRSTENRSQAENDIIEDLIRSGVKHPLYRNIIKRFRSFRAMNCPHARDPWELASAGFFFAGHLDTSACFHCGIRLRDWQTGDDPYEAHVRFSPTCPFIDRIMKSKNEGTRSTCADSQETSENQHRDQPEIRTNEDRMQQRRFEQTDPQKCKICAEDPVSIVFLPCGHLVTCAACAAALSNCPVCNVTIRGTVRVFMA